MSGKTEASALLPAAADSSAEDVAARVQRFVYGGCLGLLMITVSAALINLNKYLMAADHFPFAVVMVMMQSIFCTAFAGLLLLVCPSLFPALTDPEKRVDINMDFLLTRTAPITVLFTTSLILGNLAYKFASVAFLQMLKQSNVVIVYILSVIAAMEVFKVRSAILIVAITTATAFTVHGELHFSMLGLLLQCSCCFAESSKIVVQGMLLSGGGRKLDGLSYVLVVMPQVALGVGMLVLVDLAVVDLPFVTLPTLADVVKFRWLLAANVMIAFALNLIVALFIKNSSPLAFLLANIAKDVMIVLGSAAVFGEPLSSEQMVAFPVQLALLLLWSLMKSFPEVFAEGGRLSFILPSSLREKRAAA